MYISSYSWLLLLDYYVQFQYLLFFSDWLNYFRLMRFSFISILLWLFGCSSVTGVGQQPPWQHTNQITNTTILCFSFLIEISIGHGDKSVIALELAPLNCISDGVGRCDTLDVFFPLVVFSLYLLSCPISVSTFSKFTRLRPVLP